MNTGRQTRLRLTELFGVLAILALLAAIVFPVVVEARTPGRFASSLIQYKILSTAQAIYAQDYEGAFPLRRPQLQMADPPPGACIVDDSAFTTADGGCKDLATGQVWSAQPTGVFTWSFGKKHCGNLTEGGYSDWRMPTKAELVQVAIDGAVGHLNLWSTDWFFWSSTTKGCEAWAVRPDTAEAQLFGARPGCPSGWWALNLICTRP